ncbi:glutamate--tRNA ligase [Candidatus Finniella inopinata]|uniref:Glutamate--tRNA ligase n=1 Tax=Candidatus Finniella inopinata TaxID=1696036 RepID=A0A4Q7DHY4_9PROT|nr:glutamate--tRNA ligase [Candidatus Finniella inopinata]RZI45918.1 glutamate--tRNA ligase [Candidatus Finniella inopinata]
MTVVVRFAPSPTGYLHIGGVRTALFNWLFARHHQGKFLIRIEDTDRSRSTPEAVEAIFDSLSWLGLNGDEDPVFQFERAPRHAEVARQLLAEGKAYHCYCSPEELDLMREEARAKSLPPRYDGRWRDRDPSQAPAGVAPVIRFKAPLTGETVIHDHVQGTVKLDNSQLDDMVLLRADGTPTYMLSVVVDDHDMGITHIIRGDDHLTNAFRQWHLYQACGWAVPEFAHIPLIHGPDGAKLSKRHGALGAEHYRDMGFLPEAMRNYLLRLGWGHGDEEIISTEQAIGWFSLSAIGRSPARFDMVKLTHLNAHYLKASDNQRLVDLLKPLLEAKGYVVDALSEERLLGGMPGLKERAKTLLELADSCLFYFKVQPSDEKAGTFQTAENARYIQSLVEKVETLEDFTPEAIEQTIRAAAVDLGIKLGDLAQALRVALTGRTISPSLFEVISILGKDETLNRLRLFC